MELDLQNNWKSWRPSRRKCVSARRLGSRCCRTWWLSYGTRSNSRVRQPLVRSRGGNQHA